MQNYWCQVIPLYEAYIETQKRSRETGDGIFSVKKNIGCLKECYMIPGVHSKVTSLRRSKEEPSK